MKRGLLSFIFFLIGRSTAFAQAEPASASDIFVSLPLPFTALAVIIFAAVASSQNRDADKKSNLLWEVLKLSTIATKELGIAILAVASSFVILAFLGESIMGSISVLHWIVILGIIAVAMAYFAGLGRASRQQSHRNVGATPYAPIQEAQTVSTQIPPLSQAALAQGMALKLKRSESKTNFGKPIFMLDARLEVSPEIQHHIQKYRLGNEVIYESSRRQKHRDAALAHAEGSRDDTSIFAPPAEQMKGVARTFWQLGKAGARMAMASLSLRITISSLIAGVHVECKDMDELLDAEAQITEAGRNLKSYLQEASSFRGEERLIEL
jgi:hypothetical protein